MTHPVRFSLTRGHRWGASTPSEGTVGSTTIGVPLKSEASYLIYADMRLHITMTHHNDVGPSVVRSVGEYLRRMIGVEQESWMPMMTAALYMPVAVVRCCKATP